MQRTMPRWGSGDFYGGGAIGSVRRRAVPWTPPIARVQTNMPVLRRRGECWPVRGIVPLSVANTIEQVDVSVVDRVVAKTGREPHRLIAILQALQEHYRYLPQAALERVAEITEIRPADIEGVATFFSQFRHTPAGKHTIRVCHGTACHVKGSEQVQEALLRELGLEAGADTDAAGQFTIERVGCLGCCTLAPVVQVDSLTLGHVRMEEVGRLLREAEYVLEHRPAEGGLEKGNGTSTGAAEIRVGVGSCCVAGGSQKVREALQRAVRKTGADAVVKPVGCVGMCHQTPMVEIVMQPAADAAKLQTQGSVLYTKVTAEQAEEIVRRHFAPRGLWRRLAQRVDRTVNRLLTDAMDLGLQQRKNGFAEAPICTFLDGQVRLATEYCGHLDPVDIEEYQRYGGFEAMRRVLSGKMDAGQIMGEIEASGLRGRGGAGFPTGRKWRMVAAAAGAEKFIICNGDEGDPGAFMDRMILESYPYRVLEGMIIAARAVGATSGRFYVRHEYPLAVQRIGEAMERMRSGGLLGSDIAGSGFAFEVEVVQGAGAFVCGEETALIASVEGRRGMPQLRPPYPAQQGLWNKPTLINNVETLALVPWIVRHGGAGFAAYGTPKSKGTKVFALTGKVRRGGLIEVPMGISIHEIVERIGGGVEEGKTFKAVQIGGPSGGCIPAALADTTVDYESLDAIGAIMGSGGLVVLDNDDCMVDMARYFLQFTQAESCGKCTFCRVGTRRMLEILDRLCEGKGTAGDLKKLEELAQQVRASSLCGLGQTAPNPVLTTLKYFRPEYEAHVKGVCPSGKCRGLTRYSITEKCIGCTICARQCPVDAIAFTPYQRHVIDQDLCTKCDVCRKVCPENAVTVESVQSAESMEAGR